MLVILVLALVGLEGVARSKTSTHVYGADGGDGSEVDDKAWHHGEGDLFLGYSDSAAVEAARGSTVFRGNQTATSYVAGLPGFVYPEGLVPGTTYYWRIDEVNEADPNSPWKGPIWNFSVAPKKAYNADPADGAEFVDVDVELSWTAGLGAVLHSVYFGDNYDDIKNATGGLKQVATTYMPERLEFAKIYYWRVDEVSNPRGGETRRGDIWSFTTPGAIGNPQPAYCATDVGINATITWTAADSAALHQLYFGTDKEAVRNADTSSPEYIGSRMLGGESFEPGLLEPNTSYYWRVDEVDGEGNVSTGPLWIFTTSDFLLVDGFESYNDIDPPDPASNRIFDKWIDGFGTIDNGALIGNDMPSYAEQIIVHSGTQSMPYFYDNNNKTSEASLMLIKCRDWTEGGITTLSLWFHGASANAADRIFVALNGTAVVYHDDPAATQITGWNELIINLQQFYLSFLNLFGLAKVFAEVD